MKRMFARVTVAIGAALLAVAFALAVTNRPAPTAGEPAAFTSPDTLVTESTTAAPAPTGMPAVTITPDPTAAVSSDRSLPRFTVTDDRPTEAASIPVALDIPSIGVSAPIRPVGIAPDGGMEIPGSVSDVGWYRFGPAPGRPGSAVLAAHVDLAGQGPGVFYDLGQVEPGDLVEVHFEDGSTAAYRAEARATYGKDELPIDALFRRDGAPVLTLVTCGGDFNRALRSYASNVVVYAVPVTDQEPTTLHRQENQ